jgi:hypothetical protein
LQAPDDFFCLNRVWLDAGNPSTWFCKGLRERPITAADVYNVLFLQDEKRLEYFKITADANLLIMIVFGLIIECDRIVGE